jgi:microcystin-dependent protein
MSGEERHALAIGEVPSHSHTGQTSSENVNHSHNVNGGTSWNDRDHTHGLSGHVATTGGGYWGQGWSAASNVGGPAAAVTLGGGWPGDSTGTGGASTPHAHTFNVQSGIENTPHVHWITAEGGNGSHNNMQPYAVANVFIKT